MNKLLIAFGLIILFVTLPCASQRSKFAHKVDDVNKYDDDFQQSIFDDDDFQKIINDKYNDFQEIINDEDDFQQVVTDKDDFQEIIIDEDDNGDRTSNEDICDDVSYTTKGKFVESDGIKKTCATHSDCYDQLEPPSWRYLNENQSWVDNGCYCDRKENACIIERKNRGELEYTYCAPEHKVDDVNEYNDDFQQIIADKGDDFQEIITDKDDNGDKASDEDISDDDSYTTKRKFVESDGIKKTCTTHSDCYDQREPSSWRYLNENQSWTDKGCYCDRKENACIIERKNRGELEYTYCAPEHKVDDVNEYNDDFQQNIIDEDDFQQNIIDEDDFQQIITDKDDDFQEIITDKDDNGDKASDEDICEDDSYTTQRKFVESDGIKRTCATHSDCYDQREPSSWCDLNENQTWVDNGCYCDRKENACVIERKNRGELEYTYCAPEVCWRCA